MLKVKRTKGDIQKSLQAIMYSVRNPKFSASAIRGAISSIYVHGVGARAELPSKHLNDLIDPHTETLLSNCFVREGNVTLQELLTICLLVKKHQPKNILEIGTFDGNTTLNMALNAPDDAHVHTLDLPPQPKSQLAVEDRDVKFINDKKKLQRKYLGSRVESKITQHLGDSASYDFDQFGQIDFAFIDGSHVYEYAKNDTEKVLENLSPTGAILWHDYKSTWLGVTSYLDKLSKTLPIVHIKGTTLAYLMR